MNAQPAMFATQESKHIGIFLPTLHGGGAERVLLDLASEFVRLNHQVDLVLMNACHTPLMDLVPDSIRVVDLGCPRLWNSTPAMTRYLRTEQPDAVLAAMPLANAIAAYARAAAGVPVRLVLSEHNAKSIAFGDIESLRDRVLGPPIRFAYRLADCIVAVSHGVADRLLCVPGVRKSRVQVVYNSVAVDNIERLAAEPVPHPWLADRSVPVVIGSGRLENQKDFETLLRAFALLRARLNTRLMILGEGSLHERLQSLCHELKIAADVVFPGFVVNPWAYMSRAAVFALSSVHEGLSMVLIESLACGTPVVSTDCPSGPAEILANGRFGTLVPMGDSAALAEGLYRTLESPPSQELLKQRARDFSIDVSAAGYLRAFSFTA